MILSILFPGMYLLFIQAFPKDAAYVTPMKYFAGGVAMYNFLIGFIILGCILSLGAGSIPLSLFPLFTFAVGSTLALLPVFGLVFIAVGWHTVE